MVVPVGLSIFFIADPSPYIDQSPGVVVYLLISPTRFKAQKNLHVIFSGAHGKMKCIMVLLLLFLVNILVLVQLVLGLVLVVLTGCNTRLILF